MAINRYYSSIASPTTLAGNISAGATSVTVVATTGFPPSVPYTLALDYGAATEELVDVTAVAGTSLTVTRGVDGTSAQSHGIGAVVRHVASGRDFADFQAHQNAVSGVHGIAGTLVGTADTQTLSNKTLTSPTINAGALSGAFTGTPTFSGNVTFSGAPVFNGSAAPSFQRSTVTGVALKAQVTGDAQDRFQAQADGKLLWGSGSAAQDVNLYRSAADVLATDDRLSVIRTLTTDLSYHAQLAGDTGSRWYTTGDGALHWGNGTGLVDVNLYRGGTDLLETDDSFLVGGDLMVSGQLSVTGIGRQARARKTADTSRSSTVTLVSDPHLSVAVVANAVYELEGILFFTSSSLTPDLKFGINGPAGAAGFWSAVGPSTVSTSDPDTVRTIATNIGTDARAFGIPMATTATSPAFGFPVRGMVEIASTAGNITVDWSQNTSDPAGLVLKTYSWLRLIRVA